MYSWKLCSQQAKNQNFIQRLFSCGPSVLDYHWRTRDFRFHRSYGGFADKRLKVDGHAPLALILPAIAVIFLIYGPSLGWRGLAPLLILIFSYAVLYAVARFSKTKYLMLFQLVFFICLSILMWFVASPEAREADVTLYRHFLILAFPVVTVLTLLIARLLAWLLFKALRERTDLKVLLPHVNLFVRPPRAPEFSLMRIVRSLVNVPLRYPLHLVFFPALGILFLPYFFTLRLWALVLVVIFWLLISFASIHDRFNAILPLIQRAFFLGGQLVISLVIIVLSAGRLLEISYIQTVVESSSWDILLIYIASAYVSFWFLEYWINRILCEEVLRLVQQDDDPPGKATYKLDEKEPLRFKTRVDPDQRTIQVHGGGRLIVIGQILNQKEEAYQTYEKKELFRCLIENALSNPMAPVTRGIKGNRKPALRKIPAMISRRTRFYFSLINVLLIASVIGTGLWLNQLPQAPIAVAGSSRAQNGVRLAELIWQHPDREKVILLAASGGGTRAAIYTQSVLQGLHSIGVIDDLVLVSGVSGGGAALAYFAAHRKELMDDKTGGMWQQFSCDMSYPYIWDVLEGATEWRIVSGTRMGQLLAESFCRVFYLDCPTYGGRRPSSGNSNRQGAKFLGEVQGMGLILNTTLAGRLDGKLCEEKSSFPETAAECFERTDGSIAGGRLIFSNLANADAFPKTKTSLDLPYIVVNDSKIRLVTAAALNANFPPVFSNAPVDVDKRFRFWVTDGGATENRGLISLLLALKGALLNLPDRTQSLPEIHIVMADASAGSTKYAQDRGIGTLFGAPAKIANQLIRELLEDVKRLYAGRQGNVYYHELAMPDFLRIDGGLGTHWMLPRTVEIKIPSKETSGKAQKNAVLDAYAVRHIINDLHRQVPEKDIRLCQDEGINWIVDKLIAVPRREKNLPLVRNLLENSNHRKAWKNLVTDLSGKK